MPLKVNDTKVCVCFFFSGMTPERWAGYEKRDSPNSLATVIETQGCLSVLGAFKPDHL